MGGESAIRHITGDENDCSGTKFILEDILSQIIDPSKLAENEMNMDSEMEAIEENQCSPFHHSQTEFESIRIESDETLQAREEYSNQEAERRAREGNTGDTPVIEVCSVAQEAGIDSSEANTMSELETSLSIKRKVENDIETEIPDFESDQNFKDENTE